MKPEMPLSISQYLDVINEVLKHAELDLQAELQGEVSSFTDRGNTVFFTVSDTQEKASMSCLIWKSVYNSLGIELEEGLEIKMRGNANIYKPSGRFSFVAKSIIPIGEGALQKAFEKLKKKLEELGYFKEDRKREIPKRVRKIGLITADESDAKKDFETHLGKFGYKIYFYDVRVEGTKSIEEITKAFKWFNEATLDLDVIVLTRGGGSLENLQAFTSEGVAKAIYSSKIPVISGVGHENDVTISDLVADIRASTPTHAARIIAQGFVDIKTFLETSERIQINQFKSLLQNFYFVRDTFIKNFISLQRNVDKTKQDIQHVKKQLIRNFEKNLFDQTNKIKNYETVMKLSDPKLKLKQGYSITRDHNNNIIKSIKQLKEGDIINTEVYDGTIKSKEVK